MAIDVPVTASPPVQAAPATTLPQTAVPADHQLKKNPMLPQHPLGAYTDAKYESDIALLQNEVSKRYADILQQLGYTDETGNFIPGAVETNANRMQMDLSRSMDLAREQVTRESQQQGTLFSGIRGTRTGRAEFPFANDKARLDTEVPLQLQQLYENAGGLVSEFTMRQNGLLADAAARRAATAVKSDPNFVDPVQVAKDYGADAIHMGGDVMPPHAAPVTAPPAFAPIPQTVPTPMPTPVNPVQPGAPPAWTQQPGTPPTKTGPADPHMSVTDIHKASLNAIQKLNEGRGQRLGF